MNAKIVGQYCTENQVKCTRPAHLIFASVKHWFTSQSACPRLSWPPSVRQRAPCSRAKGTPGAWELPPTPDWSGNAGWRAGSLPPPATPRLGPRHGHRTASSRLSKGEEMMKKVGQEESVM